MNANELRTTNRAVIEVPEALQLLPLAERSLRRALEPGGDLEHLALRVGRRCFVKVAPLLMLLDLAPDKETSPVATELESATHDENGPRRDGSRMHLAG